MMSSVRWLWLKYLKKTCTSWSGTKVIGTTFQFVDREWNPSVIIPSENSLRVGGVARLSMMICLYIYGLLLYSEFYTRLMNTEFPDIETDSIGAAEATLTLIVLYTILFFAITLATAAGAKRRPPRTKLLVRWVGADAANG
jgi:hypothetical protein